MPGFDPLRPLEKILLVLRILLTTPAGVISLGVLFTTNLICMLLHLPTFLTLLLAFIAGNVTFQVAVRAGFRYLP